MSEQSRPTQESTMLPPTAAAVANYLRQRAYEIAVELHATKREAEQAHREKGQPAAEHILGPRKLRETAAARAKLLREAADALDAETRPVRKIELRDDDEVINPFHGVHTLARRVDPQPPGFVASQSQPYSFWRDERRPVDEWSIGGACGFVRDATGQSVWRCPFGGVGEVVLIDSGWFEVIDVQVERRNGDGDWFWVATFRRAEMGDWRTAP